MQAPVQNQQNDLPQRNLTGGWTDIVFTVTINVVVGILLIILHAVFESRGILPSKPVQLRRPPPPLYSSTPALFRWIRMALGTPTPAMLGSAGLDAVLLVRFIRLCLRLAMFSSLWGLCVLVPLYITSSKNTRCEYYTITMTSLPPGSKRLWTSVAFQYLFTLHAIYLLRIECFAVASMRRHFLSKGDPGIPSQSRYSVIVEVVPETLRSTVALEAFYEDLGFDVYSAVMVPDVFTLEEILALRERTAGQLQKVLNAIHRGSTKAYRGWWDLCGTDARLELEQLKDKYDTLTTKANTERTAVKRAIECLETMDSNIISRMKEKINTALDKSSPGRFLNPVHLEHSSAGHVFTPTDDKDEDDDNNNKLSAALIAKNVVKEQLFSLTLGFRAALGATGEISESVYRLTLGERMGSTAFVTFHSLLDATTACQVRMVQNAQNFITSPAPEPQDIIWRNIAKPLQQVYNRCRLANCAFALLAIFWTLPVTFVQAISSLEQLQVFIPALKHLKAGSILYNVLSSYLPVMALLGLMLLLPVLFRVSNFYYEGVKLSSAIEQSILTRYFFFSFVNIFVTVSSGSVFSALGDILESPRQLLDILGHTFPNISFYMINLIATQAFIGLPFELSQIGPTFGGLACGSVTAIEFPYGVRYSAMLFVLLIAMMYSVIAPLVSVAAALFFSMALCTYKFLLLRCYHTPYEGGAIAWGRIYQKIIICMVCSQLTLAGYCGLRGGYLQIPCLLILPVVTYFSYDYNDTRYTAPSSRISRELASEVDKLKEQENEDVMKEFHIEAYAPPCIISPIEEIIVEEVDVAVRGDGRHYTRLDT